jgi:hypothetical protein
MGDPNVAGPSLTLALLLDCPNGRMWGMNRRNVASARAA